MTALASSCRALLRLCVTQRLADVWQLELLPAAARCRAAHQLAHASAGPAGDLLGRRAAAGPDSLQPPSLAVAGAPTVAAAARAHAPVASPRRWHSTHPESAAEDADRNRFVKYLVLAMMAAAGTQVLPGVGEHSVVGAVGLLSAQSPLLLRSGCTRLRRLARSEAAAAAAVDAGAVPRLLALLEADVDAGVTEAALQALATLTDTAVGLRAFQEAQGSGSVVRALLAHEVLQEAPAVDAAHELLRKASRRPQQ